MALQKSYTTLHGFVCPEAYIVIENGSYRKDTGLVTCFAKIYKDLASRDADQPPIGNRRFSYTHDTEGAEMVTQAYTALKAEDDMAGAIDV